MKSKLLALCMMIVALIVTTGRPAAIFAADATPTPATNAAREAAQALALKLVGGKAIGGTVSMMGVNGGAYGDLFLSVFKPFEDATGIKIDYEGTQDLDTVLQTRVDSGNPPDIIVSPSVGNLLSYAHNGKLVDLGQFMDVSAMKDSYGADLLGTFTIDGKLYGFFETASLEGLIWYNAKQYKGPNTPKDWAELEDWAAKTKNMINGGRANSPGHRRKLRQHSRHTAKSPQTRNSSMAARQPYSPRALPMAATACSAARQTATCIIRLASSAPSRAEISPSSSRLTILTSSRLPTSIQITPGCSRFRVMRWSCSTIRHRPAPSLPMQPASKHKRCWRRQAVGCRPTRN